MRDCLDRNYRVGLDLLALIEAFDLCIITDRKMRRFYKCPRQVLVPVLDIPLTFAFPVTQVLRGYPGTLVGESRDLLDSWRTA
jgi:hypothetical protein